MFFVLLSQGTVSLNVPKDCMVETAVTHACVETMPSAPKLTALVTALFLGWPACCVTNPVTLVTTELIVLRGATVTMEEHVIVWQVCRKADGDGSGGGGGVDGDGDGVDVMMMVVLVMMMVVVVMSWWWWWWWCGDDVMMMMVVVMSWR